MGDIGELQRLMVWLSPAFPVGNFAYSAGLETAIASGGVTDAAGLADWLEGSMRHGAARVDLVIAAEAHRRAGNTDGLRDLADFCLALTPSGERYKELFVVGDAFVEAASAWPAEVLCRLPRPCPYPVAVGAIAAGHAIGLLPALTAFLTAYAQTQISVAVRLVPLGQADGVRLLAALEKTVAAAAADASTATLEDMGAIGYGADIAAMQHETLGTRIFRS